MLNPGLFVSVSESPPVCSGRLASKLARLRIGQRGFADGIEARAAGHGWPVCGFADGIDDCMDAGGTTPGTEEVERRREQPPRATPGAVAEGWPVCGFADGIDDCMDAGGRATPGAVAEARAAGKGWPVCGFADGIEARAAGKGWPVCGFTLIELIVIIVVIAILAVVAMPRLLDFGMFNEVGFHDAVKASVQYARKLAVGSRRYVCVDVTPGTGPGGRVAISQVTTAPEALVGNVVCPATPISLPAASNVAGCAVNEVCAPNGVTLGGPNLIFDPLGRPVAADKTPLTVALAPLTVTNQLPISIQLNTGLVQ